MESKSIGKMKKSVSRVSTLLNPLVINEEPEIPQEPTRRVSSARFSSRNRWSMFTGGGDASHGNDDSSKPTDNKPPKPLINLRVRFSTLLALDEATESNLEESALVDAKIEEESSSPRLEDLLPNKTASRVQFGNAEIRQYPIILDGSTAIPRFGPPIGIDWKHVSEQIIDVDDYEMERLPLRRTELKQLVVPSSNRLDILKRQGYSLKECNLAKHDANRIRQRRVKSSTRSEQFDEISILKESALERLNNHLCCRTGIATSY